MEKCLVEKLKGSVNNNTLERLGEIFFEFYQVENPNYQNRNVAIYLKEGSTSQAYTEGDIHFTNNSGSSTIEGPITLNAGLNNIFISNGNGRLYIKDKYNVINIGASRLSSPNAKFDVSQLSYAAYNNFFTIYMGSAAQGNLPKDVSFLSIKLDDDTNIGGDISEIDISQATIIQLNGTAVSGEITTAYPSLSTLRIASTSIKLDVDSVHLTNLQSISARRNVNVTGHIESLSNKILSNMDFFAGAIEGKIEDYVEAECSGVGREGNTTICGNPTISIKGIYGNITYYVVYSGNSAIVKSTNSSGAVVATYDGTKWYDSEGNEYTP